MNSFDIGGYASLLIQQHGEWAEWKATERAVALLGIKDYEGVEAFLQVAEAIATLQSATAAYRGLLH